MIKNKKGQIVTEYLHTYGWVIIVCLMLGGVLIYNNIKTPRYLMPFECQFFSGIGCLDAVAEDTELRIELVNEFGFAIRNITARIEGTCNSTANTTDGNPYNNPNTMLMNMQKTMTFECQNLTGIDLEESINLTYISVETGAAHQKIGSMDLRVGE